MTFPRLALSLGGEAACSDVKVPTDHWSSSLSDFLAVSSTVCHCANCSRSNCCCAAERTSSSRLLLASLTRVPSGPHRRASSLICALPRASPTSPLPERRRGVRRVVTRAGMETHTLSPSQSRTQYNSVPVGLRRREIVADFSTLLRRVCNGTACWGSLCNNLPGYICMLRASITSPC